MDNKYLITLCIAIIGWALREYYLHIQKRSELSDKKLDALKDAMLSNTFVNQELKIEIKYMRESYDSLKTLVKDLTDDMNALHAWKRSVPTQADKGQG